MSLCPKCCSGSEPEAPLAMVVPRLHLHVAQRLETSRSMQVELAAAGQAQAGQDCPLRATQKQCVLVPRGLVLTGAEITLRASLP